MADISATTIAPSAKLFDLFTADEFDDALERGLIRRQVEPDGPLMILNYTERAQYENVWNDVTRNCRGLIVGPTEDGMPIVARPWAKFFNYGDDANTGPLDLNAPVEVTDKLDGSLGILYPHGDTWRIATRGSFASDQAIHGTAVLARYLATGWRPELWATYLFEIVYPSNRIVVDYGGIDDLVLLGAVGINSGRYYGPWISLSWPGRLADWFTDAPTFADALALPPRANAEGVVVRNLDTGQMVKVKQADYVALHRIVTGLNARTVWQWLGDGKTVGDLCATLPDEFHGWVEDVAGELNVEVAKLLAVAHHEFASIKEQLPADHTRGQFAQLASRNEHSRYLFLLLDGQYDRAAAVAWQAVKPSGARTLLNRTEDVA